MGYIPKSLFKKDCVGGLILYRNNETKTWTGRIDIKNDFRGNGFATQLLTEGDKYLSKHHSGDLREFRDLNNRIYHGYLDSKNKKVWLGQREMCILFDYKHIIKL